MKLSSLLCYMDFAGTSASAIDFVFLPRDLKCTAVVSVNAEKITPECQQLICRTDISNTLVTPASFRLPYPFQSKGFPNLSGK